MLSYLVINRPNFELQSNNIININNIFHDYKYLFHTDIFKLYKNHNYQ